MITVIAKIANASCMLVFELWAASEKTVMVEIVPAPVVKGIATGTIEEETLYE